MHGEIHLRTSNKKVFGRKLRTTFRPTLEIQSTADLVTKTKLRDFSPPPVGEVSANFCG